MTGPTCPYSAELKRENMVQNLRRHFALTLTGGRRFIHIASIFLMISQGKNLCN